MSKWKASFVVAVVSISGLVSPVIVVAQPAIPVGSEFQVNAYTTSYQRFPAVAAATGGAFVVVWHSYGQDGANAGIFARQFNAAGVPQATEFQAHSYTVGATHFPAVAVSTDGSFMVAWESGGQDGSYTGIFARRFDAAGAAQATEFQVNTFATREQRAAALAASSAGGFIVAWESNIPDGDGYGVFARRYDSAGAAQAAEFQINSHTAGNQLHPALATQSDGDFVVVWQSAGQDGSVFGVFARRFDSAGAAQATEFQVNTRTASHQRYPAVATSSDGAFIVAWQSYGQDGDVEGVFARRFDAAGAPLASEFQANSYTTANQRFPAVATDGDGGFIVAWEDSYQDGGQGGLVARRFDAAGTPLASEFQINTHTLGTQRSPAVAMDADGDFLVAWQSQGQDGDNDGIFAQRFSPLAILDVDGDGTTDPLTDGLLVLRFRFGFTAATLTTGAVDAGCTRCDAAPIEAYLGAVGVVLDIDGNGSLAALTDGLLVLRFLFGFTGTTLTTGAVGVGCTRCDASTIVPYLQGLS